MRQRILDTAMEQFTKDGYDKLSLRKVAKEMEYSPGTLYLHFKNKDEIYYALHDQCFRLLQDEFLKHMQIPDPLDRLRALGRTYISFGLNNPEKYNLMFIEKAPMEQIEGQETWECAKRTFDILVESLQACIDAEYFPNKNVMQVAMITYSAVHGMVSLELHRHLKMFPEESKENLINDTNEYLIQLLMKS